MEATIKGPEFKSESEYLTQEGYPLGTTCFFYVVVIDGYRKFCCGDTEIDAWKAVLEYMATERFTRPTT